MSREVSRRGQLAIVVMVGLTVLAIPAGVALSLPATSTTAGVPPTPPPILNLTDTPTETPTDNGTATSTSTGTPDDTPTDASGSEGTNTGQTIIVDNNLADCPKAEFQTIQSAVDAASAGDRIQVCAGTYSERVDVPVGKSNLTLDAKGDAVIVSAGEPAIWTNASGIAIQGFEVRATHGAQFAIVVGGQNAVIRNNTVQAINGTGIFISDGLTPWDGTADPDLGAATGSRVVNNTVTARDFRIWTDADQTFILNNSVSDLKTQTDSERRACDGQDCKGGNLSIVSSGNKTLIGNNDIEYTNHPPTLWSPVGTGVYIGFDYPFTNRSSSPREPDPAHNQANGNVVVNNTVTNTPHSGVYLARGVKGAVVRGNTLTGNLIAVYVWGDGALIKNNTMTRMGYGVPNDGLRIHGSAKIIENSITYYGTGIEVNGHAEMVGNTIENNVRGGVLFTGGPGHATSGAGTGTVIDNEIIGNGGPGIEIANGTDLTQIEVHRNRILNNSGLGINNGNSSAILDATNNIWACGGPSSGTNPNPLADPYTGRLANGSGDAISAGNESGVSNVHFDPFQQLSSCPNKSSTPTPTPTPTSTPDGGAGGGGGDDTGGEGGDGGPGGAGGEGSGEGSGEGERSGDTTGGDSGSGGDQTTPSQTPSSPTATATPTPPKTPPTDSPTPTPAVEPGFGIGTWLVGVFFTAGLLALRRRDVTHE